MNGGKKRILIVDDEEEICTFLKEELEKGPFEVGIAFTGEEALKSLAEKPFDLAVIDLKLSTAVTGLDVIRKCREASPQMSVLAMTGYVDIKLQEEVARIGVSDYLEKPSDIQPGVIQRKVAALLNA